MKRSLQNNLKIFSNIRTMPPRGTELDSVERHVVVVVIIIYQILKTHGQKVNRNRDTSRRSRSYTGT